MVNIKKICARLAQVILDCFVLIVSFVVVTAMLSVAVWMRLRLAIRAARQKQADRAALWLVRSIRLAVAVAIVAVAVIGAEYFLQRFHFAPALKAKHAHVLGETIR